MKKRTSRGRFATNKLRKNASSSPAAYLPNYEEEETISEGRPSLGQASHTHKGSLSKRPSRGGFCATSFIRKCGALLPSRTTQSMAADPAKHPHEAHNSVRRS